eukprot:m.218909 g.218909  ORF g.218909 m.218909 type:complete len:87 (+) comp17226_c0_seq3:420-680(+)
MKMICTTNEFKEFNMASYSPQPKGFASTSLAVRLFRDALYHHISYNEGPSLRSSHHSPDDSVLRCSSPARLRSLPVPILERLSCNT